MNITDVDPKYGLPLWWELVQHFRKHPPLVQAPQALPVSRPPQEKPLISRVWHGWASPGKADVYEAYLRSHALPAIRELQIPGLHGVQVSRRDGAGEVEFVTEMWFDDLAAVRAFAGEDYSRASVSPEAAAMLTRFDSRVQHYEIRIER